jgi:hypothetical protein
MMADTPGVSAEERVAARVGKVCAHDGQQVVTRGSNWSWNCPECWTDEIRAAEAAAFQRGVERALVAASKLAAGWGEHAHANMIRALKVEDQSYGK